MGTYPFVANIGSIIPPLPVADGGTNAITAAAALTSLGALPVAGGSMTGNATLAAGTTVLAPLTFQSGTNLTTAAAGDAEFDGTAFYLTALASSRQVVTTQQIQILSGPYTLANNTNAQSLFNATANGALTVEATTTYQFEMVVSVTGLSGSSHTINLGFALGGSATLTGMMYNAQTATAAGGAASSFLVTTNAATAITAANTGTVLQATIRGAIRVNASPSNAGTITPQITQVTASAAAVVGANSFMRFWPVGTNAVTNVGDWS